MDLQKLKSLFFQSVPWEIDFRDTTIVSKAAFHSIKIVLTVTFLLATAVLGIWCGFEYVNHQNKSKTLSEIDTYISKNEKIAISNTEKNKVFIEEKNKLINVFGNYNTGFSTFDFLKDLISNKSSKIKFSTIIIQDNKEYSQDIEKEKPNFSVQLYGSVNEDVSYLDTYKEEVLTFPSIKHIKDCNSFIQFDQTQNSFNAKEVKFQLMVKSNG